MQTYLAVLIRRFHTSDADGALQAAVAEGKVPRDVSGDYFDSDAYLDAFLSFVADTNCDGEAAVWNHLVFDLLIPMSLDRKASLHGEAEYQRLMRKYWLPYLNECGSHKVIKSLVRLILAPYQRSERRNAIVLQHSSVSFSGRFGHSQDTDALQEEYVFETKKFMPKTINTKNLASTLFRRGANLGLPLQLMRYLQRA